MLILIEFNELCPNLLKEFMRCGTLPNFKRLFDSSVIYTTHAEEQYPNLEPWIQWPTVHSGMPYSEHKIFHLGDGRLLVEKCVAEILSDNGVPAGVFMSMNINYTTLNGYMVPDPWDKEGRAHPDWLQEYFETISLLVRESSDQEVLSTSGKSRLLKLLLKYGLSSRTAFHVTKSLLEERLNPGLKWRRAAIFDRLQYDIFRELNRRTGVQFCTFFCNSTAHFQHYFWRNMEPEKFTMPPPKSDDESLREAIPYGYRSMDIIIGQFLRDYPTATLMLCTALSQKPWVETTKCTFRPKTWNQLFDFAGFQVPDSAVKPVMAEQFHIDFDSEEAAAQAGKGFAELTVYEDQLMFVEQNGKSLFVGCRVNDARAAEKEIVRLSDGARCRFSDLFYMIHSMRSGRHHPDGALWIRSTGKHAVVKETVPLTKVAPTILSYFQVERPKQMIEKPLPV